MVRTMHLWQKMLALMFALFVTSNLFGQLKVTGTVLDGVTNEPLPGVNIVVEGTTLGTVSDIDGKYSISVSDPNSNLTFSFIGYIPEKVAVNGQAAINITLLPSVESLEEVVVTGYGGSQKRKKLTNSIASVKNETLKSGMYSNPAQALSGAVSGLKVAQVSGNPGSVPTITLRGGTNFDGSGSPLVMIDGQVRSSLSDINPEDIESIEVLKDAGATALYGARANNGVILITSKKGKAGKTQISLKSKIGLNYLDNVYDFLGAEDYLNWVRTGVYNSGRIYQDSNGAWKGYGSGVQANLNGAQPYGLGNLYWDPANPLLPLDGTKSSQAIWSPMKYSENLNFLLDQGWKTMTDPITGEQIIFSEFDRSSTAFNKPSLTQDYNISMSGGNENGSYYAGIGYYDAEGLPVNTFYKRLNFVFNGDYKIKTWLTSSSSLQYTNARWRDVPLNSEANYFARMLSAPPTQREYNANGVLLLGTNATDGNPLFNDSRFKRNNATDKINFAQSFKIDLYKGLSLKLNATMLYDEGLYENFNQDYLQSPNNWNRTRSSSASFERRRDQTYNAILNYDVTIAKDHSLNALAGFEFYDTYTKGISASGSGAPTDDFMDLQYTSAKENLRSIDSYHFRERIMSFLSRVNYDYKEKYLLSFTLRRDGYSRLLGDNRWGIFPGISGGWVISREEFMKGLNNILSSAKLRASYGLNGNVSNIGAYELQGSYGSSLYNTQIGYALGSIPNPSLKWERSNTTEFGIDLGFLENRIMSTFNYYTRTTLDKYANIPLPETSGISSIRSNNGELRNRGVEMDFDFRIIRKKELTWSVTANISHNINTVIKLPYNGLERNRQGAFQVYDGATGEKIWVGGYQEGQRPGAIYAFIAEGIYKDDAQVMQIAGNRTDITSGNNGSNGKILYGPTLWAAMTDAQKANGIPIQPGDVIWKDVNGDNVIDNFDMVEVGNVNPKWFGGFSTTASWKGLTFYARFDYSLDFQQVDNIRPWFLGMMQGSFNTLEDTKNTWTPENPNAEYPRYLWADQLGKRNYARQSSMFVYNSSYLNFREVSLTYSLPKKWMDMMRIGGAEFNVTGQNLGYLTKSKLYTPENSSSSGIGGGYPLPRTVIFGLNLQF